MTTPQKTVVCPGCAKSIRVCARVMSDGNEYAFYLCGRCEDVVLQDPTDGTWRLRGEPGQEIANVVEVLRSLAAANWTAQSRSREPLNTQRLPTF